MFNLKISDMKLTKELIVDVLNNNKTDLYDEVGNVIHGIDAVDFGYAADEILNQLEDDEDMPPQIEANPCSTSLPLAHLYSFAEKLASGDHEWRYDKKDGLWHKDGWVSRTTDELLQLFPERL